MSKSKSLRVLVACLLFTATLGASLEEAADDSIVPEFVGVDTSLLNSATPSMHSIYQKPFTAGYHQLGSGVATTDIGQELWLWEAWQKGQGLEACYKAVLADQRCSTFWTYVGNGDGNCGCRPKYLNSKIDSENSFERSRGLAIRYDGGQSQYYESFTAKESADAVDKVAADKAAADKAAADKAALEKAAADKAALDKAAADKVALDKAKAAADKVTAGNKKGTPSMHSIYQKPFTAGYNELGSGVAASGSGQEVWLWTEEQKGQGLEACYKAVLADQRCSPKFWTYSGNGDGNCGCRPLGSTGLAIRDDGGRSRYYEKFTARESEMLTEFAVAAFGPLPLDRKDTWQKTRDMYGSLITVQWHDGWC